MLRLKSSTPDPWAPRVIRDLDEILLDHAHLEKKAASTALELLFRYPDHEELQLPLSRLCREEMEHYERVLALLHLRGVPMRRLRPSPYMGKLKAIARPSEPLRLLDSLLVCAVIEARSCERMKALSVALPEGPARALYVDLLETEARHHQLYVDLAAHRFGAAETYARLDELVIHEAGLFAGLPVEPRLHSA